MSEAGGVSSSSGIEVDEAAAYFGVTESSDILHAMLAMSREDAMSKFFELLSDIVLKPGEFDFEAASQRMNCEGGEIYYLVAGHLGLMSLSDPLLSALGQPTSTGDGIGQPISGLNEKQTKALTSLSDPMRLMKVFAVAFQTGGAEEVLVYLSRLSKIFLDVGTYVDEFTNIDQELSAALDVEGHVVPIATLSQGGAQSAAIQVPDTIDLPQPASPQLEGTQPSPAETETTAPVPLPTSIGAPPTARASPTLGEHASVALPSSSVELPSKHKQEVQETQINTANEKQINQATQDAFAGAFNISIGEPKNETQIEQVVEVEEINVNEELVDSNVSEPEFVSAAEHFIAADEDSSGALSIEELAQATGTTLEEATELHAQADTDGDGVVSLSEFIASPAAEKAAQLPRPVAPTRKPIGQQQNQVSPQGQTQQPGQPIGQPNFGQQQGWGQQPQQWQQPMQSGFPQQQGWNQPQPWQQRPLVPPTIQSGVHCRGCGIGLDPYWRFCPVCGAQNMGY